MAEEKTAATRVLEMIVVPFSTLHPNPWNPNKMEERVYEAERQSIRRFGFIDPVLARAHPDIKGEWQIVDGEHRVKAALEEGITEGPITPVVLTDVEAKKLTIILNETRGEADVGLLGKLLNDIAQGVDPDELAIGLPYTDGELAHLIEIGSHDWDAWDADDSNPARDSGGGDEDGPPPNAETIVFPSKAQHEKFKRFAGMLARDWEVEQPAAIVKALEAAAKAL